MQTIASSSFQPTRNPRPSAHHITEVEPRIRALAAAIARDEQADAEELVQIGFEIALHRLATFQPGKGLSFYSYIYRAVREAMYVACGRDAPVDTFDDEECPLALAELTTPEDLVLEADEHEHRRRRVRAALDMLDDVDVMLLELHHVEGVTLAEAARRVGLPYHQARYRYQCAVEVMWRRLRSETTIPRWADAVRRHS